MQTPSSATRHPSAGIGMPGDRRACIAAQQAFEDLRRTYLHVLANAANAEGLRERVQRADEPVDLWLLRAPAFAALEGVGPEQRARRQLLRRSLDTVFPDMETAFHS